MDKIKNPNIKLKEKLNQYDYEDIIRLQKLCLDMDNIALKLELDYKLSRAEGKSEDLKEINEFMYYDENKLIGYIGICHYGGAAIEVNGMVHPDYRRRGIFRRLFSLVRDEWGKRESRKMLILSDCNSVSGQQFIKHTCADYDHSEYEMYLRSQKGQELELNNVILRKAANKDAKEITWQNSIYFGIEYKEDDTFMPEEEEKHGSLIYIAEVDNKIIGKVHLEIGDAVSGIYGLGVIPEHRRKGYGRGILMRAIEELKAKNSKEIMLQVVAENKGALSLYKSCGFEETSTMDYYKLCKS